MPKVGFIKDWRQELESDIWMMPPMYHRVWQWIKYSVNHSPGRIPNSDGTFTIVNPGQHATSYRLIAQGVGYYSRGKWEEPNVKTVKTILDWLEGQTMITVKSNALGTLITVENWEKYQVEDIDKVTLTGELSKHSLDTKKNDKECNSIYILFDEYSENENLRQALKDFLEMRKKIKSPMTDKAVKLLLSQLDKLGGTDEDMKIALLNQSVLNNWKSIYALKQDKQQQQQLKPQAIKQFTKPTNSFHNFDGKIDKMSEADLEEIARRKREKREKFGM